MMVYRIAKADEYLAITGVGVDTVKITKSAWVWPLQRVLWPFFFLCELH
jgi:flotillin